MTAEAQARAEELIKGGGASSGAGFSAASQGGAGRADRGGHAQAPTPPLHCFDRSCGANWRPCLSPHLIPRRRTVSALVYCARGSDAGCSIHRRRAGAGERCVRRGGRGGVTAEAQAGAEELIDRAGLQGWLTPLAPGAVREAGRLTAGGTGFGDAAIQTSEVRGLGVSPGWPSGRKGALRISGGSGGELRLDLSAQRRCWIRWPAEAAEPESGVFGSSMRLFGGGPAAL